MLVKYINRMESSASAIDEEASAIKALYEYLKKQSSAYTQEDIQDSSVVPEGHARDNRKSVYKFKPSIIGDVKFFITWIKNGAPVAVIGLRQAVTYAGQRYYTESITEDGTYNLSNGEVPSKLVILYENIPYEKLILPDSHFVRGSLSINDLQFYLEKLELDVTNTTTVLLTLLDNPNVLYEHYNIGRRNRLTSRIVREWLSDQATKIFDKIKEFNIAKRKLRNRDAEEIISKVDTILDKFVSKVLHLIIPRELDKYYKDEMEREMEMEKGIRVEKENRRDRSRSRSPARERVRPESLTRGRVRPESPPYHKKGGKRTQKKRQRKNQKK
jgi:hypothetical protein